MFYAELDLAKYTHRTIGNTEKEVTETLKKFFFAKKDLWGITLTWQEASTGGWLRVYEMQPNEITTD
jgi:hypothetical protein